MLKIGTVAIVMYSNSILQIPFGTKETKRTTVPFMYNLEKTIRGLDVVDFPGVDDMDETIPDLAELLLTLAQIVLFVVDYRYIYSTSSSVHQQDTMSYHHALMQWTSHI